MGAHGDATLPVALIQQREIELTGTFRYANTFPTAIALAASGAVDLDGLVDARFPLEGASQALEANRADPALLKVMVDITGSEPVSDVA
jgi:L-iditol 2-dehydrogenase